MTVHYSSGDIRTLLTYKAQDWHDIWYNQRHHRHMMEVDGVYRDELFIMASADVNQDIIDKLNVSMPMCFELITWEDSKSPEHTMISMRERF